MTTEDTMAIVAQATRQILAEMEKQKVPPGERFGFFHRSLERGVARMDEFGAEIVNVGTDTELEAKQQVEWFCSGVVQAAASAAAMLSVLPDTGLDLKSFALNVSWGSES